MGEKLILEFLSLRLDPGILTGAELPNRPKKEFNFFLLVKHL